MNKKQWAAVCAGCICIACIAGLTACSPQTGTPSASDGGVSSIAPLVSEAPLNSQAVSQTSSLPAASSSVASTGSGAEAASSVPNAAAGGCSREEALAIALENADVAQADAYNTKIEQDGDNGIPIYDITFETSYGDYDFEIAMEDGRIVGADYEVEEEWAYQLAENPADEERAKDIVQSKVPGAPREDILIHAEGDDDQLRWEGELFYQNIKYEFEIDARTGVILDWNADLRL